MNKGRVVDIKSDYAVVLNDKMSYEKIELKEQLKLGKEIYYFEEDKYIENKVPIKKYFLVAALFFMMLFIQPLTNMNEVYGYISVDINPSIQLEINKKFETLKINALNSDAKTIIKDDWVGKDAKVVIDSIIKETQKKGILNESRDFILVSYYLTDNDTSIEKKLINDFDEIFSREEKKYEVAIIKSDNKNFDKAKKTEKSIGKTLVNNKMKENVSDLMRFKNKIKKDKDFKVYEKRIKKNNKNKDEEIKYNNKNNNSNENDIKEKIKDKKKEIKDKKEERNNEKINRKNQKKFNKDNNNKKNKNNKNKN